MFVITLYRRGGIVSRITMDDGLAALAAYSSICEGCGFRYVTFRESDKLVCQHCLN